MPLIRKDPSAAPPPVEASLSAASAEARWAAARARTQASDVADLAQALQAEGDPRVREAILTSLSRIGGPAAVQAIIPLIRSDDASARTAALDALEAMPEALGESLPGLLSDADSDVRLLACELVRVLPGPEPARLLCDLVRTDPEPNVCGAAVEVLAEVGGPEALPALAACAERFSDQPFLVFSIAVARDRIAGGPLG